MKILGIYPHIGDGTKKSPNTRRYFPWGFATVMRCLELRGHEIEIFDIYARDLLPEDVKNHLLTRNFDCVCISGFASYNYSYILWLANIIKSINSVPVIIGGIVADLHYSLLLKNKNIDFCILGEGEVTSIELLENLSNPENVKGIAYIKNNEIIITPPRELIQNLDSLPLPNFDLWDMDIYTKTNLWADDLSTEYQFFSGNLPKFEELHPNISIFFGRGCPYKCRFCSRSYQSLRHKSADRIIEEIAYLKEQFGIKAIHFYDELVVYKKDVIIELCKKIKNLNIYWDCQARVNIMDFELMQILKDSNCYSLGFGFESGSNKMLTAMRKGTTREQNIDVLNNAQSIGMHLKIQLMCGYPGETEETINDTVDMMKLCGLPPRDMNWTTPLPGSYIYRECLKNGVISDEESYLKKLSKMNMNSPGNIILNISGLSDEDMEDLFIRGNYQMKYNFYSRLLIDAFKIKSPRLMSRIIFYFLLSNKVLSKKMRKWIYSYFKESPKKIR